MYRVLVLGYSQTGDVSTATESFIRALERPDVTLVKECIRPEEPYPYPWRSIGKFFDVLPECLLGIAPGIESVHFDPDADFDLVILAYQVWFLSPSLPIQGFLQSESARVLRDKKVITLSASRNMWNSASEKMKQLLTELGAVHIDNIVVTHQGPAWATFVSTPRALLFGKKEPLWGIFPAAGLDAATLNKLERFGEVLASRLSQLKSTTQGILRDLDVVTVEKRYVVPELLGWYCFASWARLIHFAGRGGSVVRRLAVYAFVGFLLFAILVGLPITIIISALLRPVIHNPVASYVNRLAQPSGA